MKAVFKGLKAYQEFLIDTSISVMTDNTTVVYYLNKQGGTRSKSLCISTIRILDWGENDHIRSLGPFFAGQDVIVAPIL